MNKYISKLFGVMFQSMQTRQVIHASVQHLPTSSEEWREYWQAKGFPWRTEAEIDAKRQEELGTCRAIVPDIAKGIYPFKCVKLSRADVEWLLATHENGRGPVDWRGDEQVQRMGLDFRGTDLRKLNLRNLPLTRVCGGLRWNEWGRATEAQRRMAGALLESTNFSGAHLERARFRGAYLRGANLRYAHLEESDLRWANLERADLTGAYLEKSDIDGVKLSDEKGIGPRLTDIHWGDTNLAVVEWSQVKILGDEYEARQKIRNRVAKDSKIRLQRYEQAVRANRQLAVALENQGLNENAVHFAYRGQILQRKILWKQRSFWRWSGSTMLALLAGYGYRMWRILVAYLLVILLCAIAYFVLGLFYEPHLSFLNAALTSITAFHGRVFSEPFLRSGEPQIWVTAFEAIAGLIIESVFIAMLTQRFFGK